MIQTKKRFRDVKIGDRFFTAAGKFVRVWPFEHPLADHVMNAISLPEGGRVFFPPQWPVMSSTPTSTVSLDQVPVGWSFRIPGVTATFRRTPDQTHSSGFNSNAIVVRSTADAYPEGEAVCLAYSLKVEIA